MEADLLERLISSSLLRRCFVTVVHTRFSAFYRIIDDDHSVQPC